MIWVGILIMELSFAIAIAAIDEAWSRWVAGGAGVIDKIILRGGMLPGLAALLLVATV